MTKQFRATRTWQQDHQHSRASARQPCRLARAVVWSGVCAGVWLTTCRVAALAFFQGKASDQLGQLRKCSVVRRVSGFAKWASNRVRTLSSVSGLVRASGVASGGPNPNTHPNNKAPTHTPNRTPKYQSKTLVALHRHKTETPKPSTQTPHGTQRYLTQTLDTRRIVDTWRNTQTLDHPPRATPTCETHSWST